ncbi:MAG: serine/threonine protein kinase [Pirellulaceae bacterium]|nr:serine/threonine protein kinase [Pirellulaceae bacterium]
MANETEEFDADRNPLDRIAEEFSQRCRAGDNPQIEEFVARYPAHSATIARLFPAIAAIEQLQPQEPGLVKHPTPLNARPLERVGDYRIVQEIGRGGMGIVYEAYQETLGRKVAVKILARQALLNDKHLQRFHREARMAASLHHTNIVPVFGVGDCEGHHYYVMQLIEGVGLDEVLLDINRRLRTDARLLSSSLTHWGDARAKQISEVVSALKSGVFRRSNFLRSAAQSTEAASTAITSTRADSLNPPMLDLEFDIEQGTAFSLGTNYCRSVAQIGWQIASALDYAHRQKVLHRDIKPGNLLLDRHGAVWIADFGLAKALEDDDVSRTGDIVGTLRYMSPEQFRGAADHRSDIYSFGLTLYEMLTLSPALQDPRSAHLPVPTGQAWQIVPPTKLNSSIPRDLETIVLKACASEPGERYASAGALAQDLACFLEDRPIQARPATLVERLVKWCRRNPAVASLSGLTLLLLILVAVAASTGYIRTQAALAREFEQRQLVEAEKAKAESTLQILREALDRVFNRLAPNPMAQRKNSILAGAEGKDAAVLDQPVLSKESAALLADLLSCYDRLSQQDIDSPTLLVEAADASRRVGDIHLRLGAYDQAEQAYLSSIARYQQLAADAPVPATTTWQVARLHNDLGIVYRAWQRLEDAQKSFNTAQSMLTPVAREAAASDATRFELARTWYLLSKRRPGMPGRDSVGSRHAVPAVRPPSSLSRHSDSPAGDSEDQAENLNKAIDLLSALLVQAEEPDHPEYLYLMALCYRERARDFRSPDITQAIQLLEGLISRFPGVAEYKNELSDTYASIDMRRLRNAHLPEVIERLQQAVALAESLVNEHPNIPDYAHSLAHINHRLGTALLRSVNSESTEQSQSILSQSIVRYGSAVKLQAALVEQFPDALSYRLWLAKMQESMSDSLLRAQQYAEAQALVDSSIESLEQILRLSPDMLFVHRSLWEHYRQLAEILTQQGNAERASHFQSIAAEHLRRAEGSSTSSQNTNL